MTDHPEYRSLLAAVLAAPAADLPRLVLADWLDERGWAARAELIRVQIDLARGTCHHVGDQNVPGCERCPARVRDRALRGTDGPAGLWPLFGDSLPGVEAFDTARGFVAAVRLPTADFMPHARALFTAHPIERVRLSDLRPNEDDDPGESGVWMRARARDGFNPPEERAAHRYGLPNRLFDRLAGGDRGREVAVYETEEAAWADLSAACVAFGREIVGLASHTSR